MPRDRELSRFLMAWSAHNGHRICEEAAATIVASSHLRRRSTFTFGD